MTRVSSNDHQMSLALGLNCKEYFSHMLLTAPHFLCWVEFTKGVCHMWYRSGMVNSKSFVGKILLRIKWKFELIYAP